MDPARLPAAVYAEFHPVPTNDSAEGRARNQRVDVVVLSHSGHRSSHAIDLSPKEFSLLEFLMRHSRHPVSRATIVEQVWRLNVEKMTGSTDGRTRHPLSAADS